MSRCVMAFPTARRCSPNLSLRRRLVPIGTQIFSRSHARVTLHYFHIYLPSCNFTITHLSLFTTCALQNAEDACHTKTEMIWLATSSRRSMDRALARSSGGHGFKSYRDSNFFWVPRSCYIAWFHLNLSVEVFHSRLILAIRKKLLLN